MSAWVRRRPLVVVTLSVVTAFVLAYLGLSLAAAGM
jgi:hypothetical protein